LAVRDIAAGHVLLSRTTAAGEVTTVTLPPSDHARTLAVALLPEAPSAAPEPAPAATLTALRDGQPEFLDLERGKQASFALTVGQGGLYRVQTTGRLKTAGRIGTGFIPALGEAAANGVGQNMLLQRYLRAGRYRLDVTAQDSAGHLGVSASETPLAEGADLLPAGSTRATLTPGHGVALPIRIASAGRYHLDLLGDGRKFTARLEDADGWPLRAAGDLSSIDQDLASGRYRLIVQPPSVEARVVVRLRQVVQPVALSGHGPHPLPFDKPQSLEWREPPGRDDARTPDTWTFVLAGPANVSLTVAGDGMGATLLAATAAPAAAPLGRLIAGTAFKIALPAGEYRVEARSLGRNDRLAYNCAAQRGATTGRGAACDPAGRPAVRDRGAAGGGADQFRPGTFASGVARRGRASPGPRGGTHRRLEHRDHASAASRPLSPGAGIVGAARYLGHLGDR